LGALVDSDHIGIGNGPIEAIQDLTNKRLGLGHGKPCKQAEASEQTYSFDQ
jgi:hypothetical protein